jgi:hypothetical protein
VLNIVIPMAGRRPCAQEYRTPESLIPVEGRPLIGWVVDSLRPAVPHRFHFVCRDEHLDNTNLIPFLLGVAPGCRVIPVDHPTGGSACTTLLARGWIDSDAPLAIVDPWRYMNCDLEASFHRMVALGLDAMALACAQPARWPWAELPSPADAMEATELIPVPDGSAAWACLFRRGRDFVRAADHMIFWNKRVDGQFQAVSACNELLVEGARVEIAGIGDRMGAPDFDTPRGALRLRRKKAWA